MAAILAGCVALGTVGTEGAVAAVILITCRRIWGYCYSTDETVVGYVAQMLILLAILHFFDGIQSIFSGLVNFGSTFKVISLVSEIGLYLAVQSFLHASKLLKPAKMIYPIRNLKFSNDLLKTLKYKDKIIDTKLESLEFCLKLSFNLRTRLSRQDFKSLETKLII